MLELVLLNPEHWKAEHLIALTQHRMLTLDRVPYTCFVSSVQKYLYYTLVCSHIPKQGFIDLYGYT